MEECGHNVPYCAEKVDLSEDAIYKWFSGKSTPKGSSLIKIAKLLKVTPDYILTGKEPPQSSLIQVEYREWLKDTKTIIKQDKEIKELKKELKTYKDIIEYAKKNCTVKTCIVLQNLA